MDEHRCISESDERGFIWCGITVLALYELNGTHVLRVLVNNKTLNVHVSPTGRSVRAYLNGKELK